MGEITANELKFADLRQANNERQKVWDEGSILTDEYYGNAIAGEVGEACNVVKKLARQRLGLRGSRATVNDLAEELSDAIIYIDLLAQRWNIDLGDAIRAKFNKTSDKYGFDVKL